MLLGNLILWSASVTCWPLVLGAQCLTSVSQDWKLHSPHKKGCGLTQEVVEYPRLSEDLWVVVKRWAHVGKEARQHTSGGDSYCHSVSESSWGTHGLYAHPAPVKETQRPVCLLDMLAVTHPNLLWHATFSLVAALSSYSHKEIREAQLLRGFLCLFLSSWVCGNIHPGS